VRHPAQCVLTIPLLALAMALAAGGCVPPPNVAEAGQPLLDGRHEQVVVRVSSSPPADTFPELTTITVSAVGDCILGTDSRFSYSRSFTHKAETAGYEYFSDRVRPVLAADDLTVANLETTLTSRGSPAYKGFQDQAFWFRGPEAFTGILRAASIEAVNIANNHSYDFGLVGFEDTQRALQQAGLAYFGYDLVASVEVSGKRIALLGFNQLGVNERGTEPDEFAARVLSAIGAVRPDHDLVIVSFHWGVECSVRPTAAQVNLAHQAVEAGADLILGHHPHWLQGVETYRQKHIVYSLGNFMYGGSSGFYDEADTMIYQETFTFLGPVLTGQRNEIIPAKWSGQATHNDYQPRLLTAEEQPAYRAKLIERTILLEELAAGRPESGVDRWAEYRRRMYSGGRTYDRPELVTAVAPDTEPGHLVDLRSVAADVVYQPVYKTAANVTGRPLYYRDYPYLRVGTARKLALAQELAARYGYRIKVWDAYRPPEAQWMLWDHTPDARYVASPLGSYSAHNRAAALDVTLVDREGAELPMPSPFDDFSARADRDYRDVTAEQARNARLLEAIMTSAGFVGYEAEWWHYSDSDWSGYGVVDIHPLLVDVPIEPDPTSETPN